jgi:kynurenine formamidase
MAAPKKAVQKPPVRAANARKASTKKLAPKTLATKKSAPKAAAPIAPRGSPPDAASLLGAMAAALTGGRIRVVDLTQTLTPEFPQIALPPEMGQCWPFRIEEVSRYDERGPGWYWNNFSCGEHTGTHFDAPIHWISGRDLPNNAVDTIPVQHFVAPAVVIDCSVQAATDPDYLLSVDDIRAFERAHGRIAAGSWVLMRTDWSRRWAAQRDAEAYQNFDETGQHTPGPSSEAVQFLVEQRDVLGFGSEAIGTDAGQGYHLRPPYPCHYFMHGAGRYGLQCLTNLDQLPPTGSLLICPPLKISQGSGSPLRVLALVAA